MSSSSAPGDGDRAAGGGDRPPGFADSRLSKTNRQEGSRGGERHDLEVPPSDLPDGTPYRPLSVEEGRGLRDEAVHLIDGEQQARPTYAVLKEWRDWYDDYRHMHMEFEKDGETARSRLENSYQPRYGKRSYAKLKDFERGAERYGQGLTTVMLTFSASSRNDEGGRRCPADHMRDIADGWDTARKQLHQALSGRNWEYAKVWEPHPGDGGNRGYGHMHVAVFVLDGGPDLDGEHFRPVMRSYVSEVTAAGSEAHGLTEANLGDAVSVSDDVENLGTYISEYIGIFGEEPTERPVSEQMFYATTWATGTRRVDFSNGAHEMMTKEQFRRETGLNPDARGGDVVDEWRETDEGSEWSASSICRVSQREPSHCDPTTGGQSLTRIDGRDGVDRPARRS